MRITKSAWLRISEALLNSDDRLCFGLISVQSALVGLSVVGIVVCLVAITLYPLFGVYRGDNFWIPAVAVLYAFVFATMLLANVLKQRKLFQAFLVVQITVLGFSCMCLVGFALVLSISIVSGSIEFLTQREVTREDYKPQQYTPWQVTWAGIALLVYVEFCSLAIPVVLHSIESMEEDEWSQQRRAMAERRQEQRQMQELSSSSSNNNNSNNNGGRHTLTKTKVPLASIARVRQLDVNGGGGGVHNGNGGSIKSVSFKVNNDDDQQMRRESNDSAEGGGGRPTVIMVADDRDIHQQGQQRR